MRTARVCYIISYSYPTYSNRNAHVNGTSSRLCLSFKWNTKAFYTLDFTSLTCVGWLSIKNIQTNKVRRRFTALFTFYIRA